MTEKNNPVVLIAPLDWGLGHATRCIPVIRCLLQKGCNVIIATAGRQEVLLKQEFPSLQFVTLNGYDISYTNMKRFFHLKILLQVPKVILAIKRENKWLQKFLEKNQVNIIISDNRYGFYNRSTLSVFITHQLNIQSPSRIFEKILLTLNYRLIEKFDHCLVPDEKGTPNLAGALSHPQRLPAISVRYTGGISRLNRQPDLKKQYDILIILSGPEPQRTLLEKKLLDELTGYEGKVLFVRGLPGNSTNLNTGAGICFTNHLNAAELQQAFAESDIIIGRSGYTTVMDIIKMKKRSILIPTPGQTEQEYLAQHLHVQKWCMAATQENFSLRQSLVEADNFAYQLPDLEMEQYKIVVSELLENFKVV